MIGSLLRTLQAFADRPLLDETQLVGNFEWELAFTETLDSSNTSNVDFATALREQLGLRLHPVMTPFDVLVIDSVSMPTPN